MIEISTTPEVLVFLASLAASLIVSVGLVATQRWHGHLSHDNRAGVQKIHSLPVPRIGGLAVLSGLLAGVIVVSAEVWPLWLVVCAALLPTFLAGLVEDITNGVRARWRLLGTILSGSIFCLGTGYHLNDVELPGLNWVLSSGWLAMPFFVVLLAGVAHAFNFIDGLNGLASGTAIIMLSGFALVAGIHGDQEILLLCLMSIGALLGFFLLNFPVGRIFLGDAGAYTSGLLVACVALALPIRNTELSPLMGVLALSYPIMELLVSINRRMSRKHANPAQPDRLHLHSLVYRDLARRLEEKMGLTGWRSALGA